MLYIILFFYFFFFVFISLLLFFFKFIKYSFFFFIHWNETLMHISCFVFLLLNYYLLFIFYVYQTVEMMLDQKQIRTVFLLEFKMSHKQWRQLTSTMHLTQELLMNVQCRDGSRSFAKEMRALMMRSLVASHRKLTMTNWEQSLKLILLQLLEKLPSNST